MKKEFPPCDLCGQPVKLTGFTLKHVQGKKSFCCEGCLRIFQLLDPEQPFSKPTPEKIS